MTIVKSIKLILLLCILVLLPLNLLAQTEDRQVALIPLWGEEEGIIQQFGEELYVSLSAMDGFQPVFVDMTDLSPDIPMGGFPPFVSPHPSLTVDMPFAVTGSVFIDPTSELRILRLYLWQASDYRPIFTDEMVATNREVVGMFLPIMLRWLFSWVPVPEEPPQVVIERQVIVYRDRDVAVYQGNGVIIYRDTSIPNRWLYFGLRAGGNVQIFDPQLFYTQSMFSDGWHAGDLDFYLQNVSAAIHAYFQFIRFNPSLFMGLQVEGIATKDFNNDTFSLMLPAILRFTIRRGTSSFSLLGGAYMFMPLPLWGEPGIEFGHPTESIGPFAGWGYTAGFGMGNRVGPGNLFVELRWSNDMFTSRITDYFRRNVASVSLGYEIGFFRRGGRANRGNASGENNE